jgi:co-chaperonin GroES (HSP10)
MNNIIIPMDSPEEKPKLTLKEASEIECPYEALMDRVILVQIQTEDAKKKKSAIYIPEHVKKSIESTQNFIIPSMVKSIGIAKDDSTYNVAPTLEVGDIVYTYPGGFEAKITTDNVDYFVFSRRDVLFKVK